MSIARAIGKSNRPPLLGSSAGARLTVMRWSGQEKCEHSNALRTRSLDSLTELSGKPTTEKLGSPLLRWASTVTNGACKPTAARDKTAAWLMNRPWFGYRQAVRAAGKG
jgi:hypothetical protein